MTPRLLPQVVVEMLQTSLGIAGQPPHKTLMTVKKRNRSASISGLKIMTRIEMVLQDIFPK